MPFIINFFLRFAALITKWALIGVLWLASILFVTSNALLMDAFSDGLSRLSGVVSPYTLQKQKLVKTEKRLKAKDAAHKRQMDAQKTAHTKKMNTQKAAHAKNLDRQRAGHTKKIRSQKALVKSHTAEVRGFSKKMVWRNTADATTSMIPMVGGLASVTFAVLDVHAACELIAMQKNLESSLGLVNRDSSWDSFCLESIGAIDTVGETAERMKQIKFPDLPQLPELEKPERIRARICVATGLGCWNESG